MMFRPSVPGFRRIGLPVPEGGLVLIWFPPSILSVHGWDGISSVLIRWN